MKPDPVTPRTIGLLTMLLMGIRFALEIGLITSFIVVGVRVTDGAVGWILGFAMAVAAAAVWGVFVAPRRQVDLALGIRLAIELALFAAAALGLVLVGLPGWAAALVALELLVVAGLFLRGVPPGTDVVMR